MAILQSCTYQFDRVNGVTKVRLIKKLSCEMTVPRYDELVDAAGNNHQSCYWPGLAPAANGEVIQPVLGILNGGSFTQMRAYTVKSEGGYINTDWGYTQGHGYDVMPQGHIHVEPGTVLHGYIEYLGKDPQDDTVYIYEAGFSNPGFESTIERIRVHQPYANAQLCVEPRGAKTLAPVFVFANVQIEYTDTYVPSGYYPNNDNSNGWRSDDGEITMVGNTATFHRHTTT